MNRLQVSKTRENTLKITPKGKKFSEWEMEVQLPAPSGNYDRPTKQSTDDGQTMKSHQYILQILLDLRFYEPSYRAIFSKYNAHTFLRQTNFRGRASRQNQTASTILQDYKVSLSHTYQPFLKTTRLVYKTQDSFNYFKTTRSGYQRHKVRGGVKTCKNTIKLIYLCALPCLRQGLWLSLTMYFDLA